MRALRSRNEHRLRIRWQTKEKPDNVGNQIVTGGCKRVVTNQYREVGRGEKISSTRTISCPKLTNNCQVRNTRTASVPLELILLEYFRFSSDVLIIHFERYQKRGILAFFDARP